MSQEIVLKNVRGVASSNIVIPVQPGGTIVRGLPGVGKSMILEAIALGLGGSDRGRLGPGQAARKAELEVCGVLVGINPSRITKAGELTAVADEEFSLEDLIYPPLKDQGAKNRHGIKSLLRISGAQADPSLFHEILGGKQPFEAIVGPDAIKSADLVDMAGKVKRAVEQASRKAAEEAEREEQSAASDRHAADGLDMEAECDQQTLQAQHTAAVKYHARLSEQSRAYRQALKARREAEERLAKSAGEYKGPTIEQATAGEVHAKQTLDEKQAEVDRIKSEIADLQSALRLSEASRNAAEQIHMAAKTVLESAKAYDKALTDANAALNLTLPQEVGEDLVDMAADGVTEAQQAVEKGAVIRAAKSRMENAKQHQEKAEAFRKESARLRDAARATDDVLSKAVASPRFWVLGDILMARLPNDKEFPYYDMSDGQRTMIAVAEKIGRTRAIEPDGTKLAIVDLPQRACQDLPPSILDNLFAMAEQANTCVVTGAVDDGELRCEVWRRNGKELRAEVLPMTTMSAAGYTDTPGTAGR